MTTLVILNLMLGACNPTVDPTPVFTKSDLVKAYENATEGINYALVGDTTLPQNTAPLHPLPAKMADVATLKAANGSFRYVAIGASLTAGVRDGGWFNEGITTAYPNLIARQMGITDFKQPLFEATEYNGYGLKLQTVNKETPINRYKAVGNNLAFKPSGTEMILSPYTGTSLDNFAVPNLLNWGLSSTLNSNTSENKYYKIFLKRQLLNKTSVYNNIDNSKIDLLSIESYTQDLIINALSSGESPVNFKWIAPPFWNPDDKFNWEVEELILDKFKAKNSKAVLLNIPNILRLPYFKNSKKLSEIKSITKQENIWGSQNGINTAVFYEDANNLFLPTLMIDSLLNKNISVDNRVGLSSKKPIILKGNILSGKTMDLINGNKKIFNDYFIYLSKRYNTPIVDIETLYKKIDEGIYVSDEGLKVTDKEFFSSDGLYPSAYGQALIANECIKTMNSFYKTNIALIKTSFYINR